jgi:hypothetical protein
MKYEEALEEMKKGHKVKQGSFIYFRGTLNPEYTLIMRIGKMPLIMKGFKKINKNGLFTNVT